MTFVQFNNSVHSVYIVVLCVQLDRCSFTVQGVIHEDSTAQQQTELQ